MRDSRTLIAGVLLGCSALLVPPAVAGPALGSASSGAAAQARAPKGPEVVVKARIWKKHGKVRIQRRGKHHRWHTIRHARVRHHRFSVKVRQRAKVARYRARSGHRHSRVIVVRRRTAPVRHAPPAATPPSLLGLPLNLLGGLTASAKDDTAGSTGTGAGSDECGPRPLKSDGTPWSCTFSAEFNGTALNRSKWLPQTNFTTGTPDAHACYFDDPNNIEVRDGALRLTVRREAAPQPCQDKHLGAESPYTAGSVMSYHLFSQKYGRFEARMKVDETTQPGLQEDFWLWPDDRFPSNVLWPAAGEIDIAELYSQYPTLAIPFLHYTAYDNYGPIPGRNTAWTCLARRGVYNTYTLEWSASALKILVNGRTCLTNSSGDPAFQKPYIIALTAALGVGTNALTDDTPLPATTSVDYVHVWD